MRMCLLLSALSVLLLSLSSYIIEEKTVVVKPEVKVEEKVVIEHPHHHVHEKIIVEKEEPVCEVIEIKEHAR